MVTLAQHATLSMTEDFESLSQQTRLYVVAMVELQENLLELLWSMGFTELMCANRAH